MADKTFTYKIKIETEDGVKEVEKTASSLDGLNEAVGDLNKELGKAELGSDEFKKLSKQVKNAEGAMEKAKNSSKGLGDQLSSIPGPVGQVVQGIKGFGTALKALALNPIGAVITAIVLAVTALYKAFTSTKAGAETLERVMAGLSAVMDVLRDRVLKVGGALVKFFKGDFKGAVEDFKASYQGIGEEMREEFRIAQEATRTLQEVKDATRELSVARAEQNKEIAQAKLLINDETLSYEERVSALEKVTEAEKSLLEQELALERQRLQAMETLAAQSDSDAETLDALAAQRVKLAQMETRSLQKEKAVFDQRKALNDRRIAEAERVRKEIEAQEQALADFRIQLNLDLIEDERTRQREELKLQRDARLQEIELLEASEEEKKELRLGVETVYQRQLKGIRDAEAQEQNDRNQKYVDEADAAQQKNLEIRRRDLDARLQLLDIENEQDLQKLKTLLDQRMMLELETENLTESEKALIRKKYEQQYKQSQDNLLKFDLDKYNQKIAAAGAAATALSGFLGQETAEGKAAASASALINTYLGASQVIADETLPSILKPILIAGIIAAGLKQVEQINTVQTPSFNQGGLVQGPGTSMSDSVSARLSDGETVINSRSSGMFYETLSLINELGGGSRFKGLNQSSSQPSNRETPVIKTYVVSSDVTSQQQLDRVVKTRSLI